MATHQTAATQLVDDLVIEELAQSTGWAAPSAGFVCWAEASVSAVTAADRFAA
ncbi:hypothetical protein [Kitasatospora azatica]|uniref:hypothetical protein n=1 Tax=Kitasatospora azatica TaxID=58347 RepID=UPI000A694522|nr:hypothetical protein [Kitasatospora azatica]